MGALFDEFDVIVAEGPEERLGNLGGIGGNLVSTLCRAGLVSLRLLVSRGHVSRGINRQTLTGRS